jgi:hypothetical protein
MFNSNESVQLFRSKTSGQVIRLHVLPDEPPNYLFLSAVLSLEDLAQVNWSPIDSSEYLGIPAEVKS